MKLILLNLLLFLTSPYIQSNLPTPSSETISAGEQPQITVDGKGIIRIAFGRNDSMFCVTSINGGASFSKPKLVGKVFEMHLGMTRGPQIASSVNFSLITAIDKEGNIHTFLLDHSKDKWEEQGLANDVRASAPEGLMGLAADKRDNFYAVWLDIRKEEKNNIYYSSFASNARKWTKNRLVYASPDEHVCECCKPSIAVEGSKIAIMFRNWVNGSRDLYVSVSDNNGVHFKGAVKLGEGTWKLNGCPMDGGGVSIDNAGVIHTVWRREGVVYYSKPNEREIEVGKGKICSISTNNDKIMVSLQDAGNVKIMDIKNRKQIDVGKGGFLKPLVLPDGKVICVWEDESEIKFKSI